MPPKLNTTSPEAKLRSSAAVRRTASSPRYCAQASRSPRFVRAPMRKARCLSWRFPTRISSPMMKAPNAKSRCLFCNSCSRIVLPRGLQSVEQVVNEGETENYWREQTEYRHVRQQRQLQAQQVQAAAP